ncbi:MAG: helix-turn-helix transcriptional regulator [Solirubrobacterales bacterium]
MTFIHPARNLVRAKDFADANHSDAIGVNEMAAAAGLSRAHFSRKFKRTFGESPNEYLLTRRLERAATLLRDTDWPVNEICLAVGLRSVGTFTTSFSRTYGRSPTEYRASMPPAARNARVPACLLRANLRPAAVSKVST